MKQLKSMALFHERWGDISAGYDHRPEWRGYRGEGYEKIHIIHDTADFTVIVDLRSGTAIHVWWREEVKE